MSDSYHQDYSAVSRSMLKLFRESRVEYHLTYNERTLPPQPPNAPMLAGTVLHAMMLEDKSLDDLVLCYPAECLKSNGAINPTPAAAFRDDHPDAICFKEQEYNGIASCVRTVLARDGIGDMLRQATYKEQRVDAVLDDVPCKCKPDIACDMGEYIVVYDLKFSQKVDPQSWRRTSKRLALWLQDAHYSRVLNKAFGKPVQFRFCNIEVKPPHRVQWYWYDQQSRDTAVQEHRHLLGQLKHCIETNNWSDNWDSVCVLEPWDLEVEPDNAEVQI